MSQLVISHRDELPRYVNTEVAITDYVVIAQDRIQRFAEITQDFQWIHTDVERAARESPYGTTIAHGFLTLSFLSHFLAEAVHVGDCRLVVSCGLGTVRFMGPVPAGSRIRSRVRLRACTSTAENTEATWRFTIEREGDRLPCCIADWVVRYCP